ncbi:MAG: hypothetical protein ACI4WU_04710 [Bacilli bacterium]
MEEKKILEELNRLSNIIEKQDKDKEKLIDSIVESLAREQDKNEITVKTIKEITKQNAIKEFAIVVSILIFLLIYYSM